MTGVVIDIATGKEIHETEVCQDKDSTRQHCKALMEIYAPDGRTVFSIGKLLADLQGGGNQESIAA